MLMILEIFLLFGLCLRERPLTIARPVISADVSHRRAVPTFREAAAKRGLLVGAAVQANEYGQPDPLLIDPMYAETLSRHTACLRRKTR
jgi:hypothetical protein